MSKQDRTVYAILLAVFLPLALFVSAWWLLAEAVAALYYGVIAETIDQRRNKS